MTNPRFLLAALLIIMCTAGCGTSKYLRKEMGRGYGMKELRPPVDSLIPGTIVYIENEGSKWVNVRRVCSKERAIGSSVEPVESESASEELGRKLSGNIKLDAEFEKELTAGLSTGFVRDITLKLKNVKVIEIDDDLARQNLKENQTEACKSAVAAREDAGKKVAMIKQSLRADAEYNVTFKNTAALTAENKEELLQGIKAKLGADFTASGDRLIAGEGLIWGITEDAALLDVGTVGAVDIAGQPVLIVRPGLIVRIEDDPAGDF